jgi:hypothetical protein
VAESVAKAGSNAIKSVGFTAAFVLSPLDAGRGSTLKTYDINSFMYYQPDKAMEIMHSSSTIPFDYISEYNKQNSNNKIVFRYMAFGEWKGKLEFMDGTMLLNIDRKGAIAEKHVTPDIYLKSSQAKSRLALPTAPDIVVWTFESQIQSTKIPAIGWDRVDPNYGEKGGGNEAKIYQAFPVKGMFILPK